VKTCVEFVFERFGSLWYNTWTIVVIACLWLVSSVDTTQARIYYIYSYPNLSQIKFLANLLAGLRRSGNSGLFPEIPGFPETPDLSRSVRTFRVYIYTLFTAVNSSFSLYRVDRPPPFLPSPPLSPSSRPLGEFRLYPSISRVSEGLKAPRRGDCRS
jgi:hypothetical protein